MRIAFSECAPEYSNYVFPYHVWAFLEEGETPATAFAGGFLPARYDLSRFYLARSVRINLAEFRLTGRIRYVQRRCAHISGELLERAAFTYSEPWQRLCDGYFSAQQNAAEHRRGQFVSMLDAPIATHVMAFTDTTDGRPVGLVLLYLDGAVAQYCIPIYDPAYLPISIGNHILATALAEFQERGLDHAYLGTCYSTGSLYKTRFTGMEFFNGYAWSSDRDELHFLLERQAELTGCHLLTFGPYLESYCGGEADSVAGTSIGRWSVGSRAIGG